MDTYVAPPGWKNGPLSPTDKELQWLFAWLWQQGGLPEHRSICSILEFGAGSTSLVIQQALSPVMHLMIENYAPVVEALRPYIPPMPRALIATGLQYVSGCKWDLVLVDSSSGVTPNKAGGYYRDKAVTAAIPYLAPGARFILHDWHAAGGRKPRRLLESLGWELEDSFYDRTGFGVYRHD